MSYAEESFALYDELAPHYAQLWPYLVPGYSPVLHTMRDVVRALPEQPKDILDLGCGAGAATAAVAPACDPTGEVTLVDGSPKMLETARKSLGDHVQCTYQGDFSDPSVARDACQPNSYNLILCTFALHHIKDHQKRDLIEAMCAAVKPGGLLLLGAEITADNPAGWKLVEGIRRRYVRDYLDSEAAKPEHLELSRTNAHLPYKPARLDDLTSWMARGGLAVSCPINVLGSALLVGLRPVFKRGT